MADSTDKAAELERIGKSAYESIAEMVAALNCDYERLEELRNERDSHNGGRDTDVEPDWATEYPDDAAELAELEADAGECKDQDDARQRIEEDPLSIQVRSGWYTPGSLSENLVPEEFEILLSTGGPAVRIIGDLDANGEPERARLQAQDWFTPWTDYLDVDQETLLTYCRCFLFGEG